VPLPDADSPIDRVLSKLSGVTTSGTTGKRFTACCPAHEDNSASLGVIVWDNGVVTLKCFAGCDNKAIIAAIELEFRDLFPGRRVREPKPGCSVSMLAFEKRLPVEFLKDTCGFSDDVTDTGRRRVFMPYRDETGEVMFTRQRRSLDGKGKDKFWQPSGMKLRPFGLWRLPAARAAGNVLVLVEGETDAVTLWLHDYPAIGIPGANAVGAIADADLAGFDVFYVWKDAAKSATDKSGATFTATLAARIKAARPGAVVKLIESPEAKDPSELNQKHGAEKFRAIFDGILAAATVADDAALAAAVSAEEPEASSAGPFRLTDMGNARRLVAQHGRDLRYSHTQDTWYVWAGNRWTPDDTGEVMRRAKLTAISIFGEVLHAESAAAREEISLHAMRSQSARSLANLIHVAKSEPTIPVSLEDLDSNPWAFNCPNGTIDLRTGELYEHRRTDAITQMGPIPYDPAATCPLWESFLASVFPADAANPDSGGHAGLIGYVQRLFGYGLTGDIREHVLPIFWGGGSNGKSTLIETAAQVFGGGYWAAAPDGMLMVRRTEAHPTELARLYRKRFVAATETDEGHRLNTALVKRLTGGDMITARFMKKDFFEYAPTHKLLICTNDRPRITSGGHAIWRRVALVPFAVKFWKAETGDMGPEHLKADLSLPTKLKAELPGILAWMVRGCLAWQRDGLQPPAEVLVATGEYRDQQNTIGAFLAELCEVSNVVGDTAVKELYAVYLKWSETNNESPLGKIRFNDAITKEGIRRGRNVENVDVWLGLKLRSEPKPRSFADYSD
jgi:putative DNA primase/helicase